MDKKNETSSRLNSQHETIKCPKCGNLNDSSSKECLKCGIVFSKYYELLKKKKKEVEQEEQETQVKRWQDMWTSELSKKIPSPLPFLLVVIVFFVAVYTYIWFDERDLRKATSMVEEIEEKRNRLFGARRPLMSEEKSENYATSNIPRNGYDWKQNFLKRQT